MGISKKKLQAFTLIELLVVIVIIGILATTGIATYNDTVPRAYIAKKTAELSMNIREVARLRFEYDIGQITKQTLMETELKTVADAIYLGRLKEKSTLLNITHSGCSDCTCRNHTFTDPLSPSAQTCINSWDNLTNIISGAAEFDISFLKSDPWGSPYLMDENEGENATYCRRDSVFSAGPDRLHEVAGENAIGDGYSIRLDFFDSKRCGL